MRGRTVVTVLLLTIMAGAGVAMAHDTSYRTSSSFGFDPAPPADAALGFINQFSGNPACQKGRSVKLYRVRRGRDGVVGADRSGIPTGSGDGHWVIEENLRNGGRYYVRIKKKNIGSGRHDHICRAYRSSTLRFPSGTPARAGAAG